MTFALGGTIVAEIILDTNNIRGGGQAEWPLLVIPLRINFRCSKDYQGAIDFRTMGCRISLLDGGPHIGAALPTSIDLRLPQGNEHPNLAVLVEIPLDRHRVALLNRVRNGGDVFLRLDLELLADELIQVGTANDALRSPVWGHKCHTRMTLQSHLVIPRSRWLEQVLPLMGVAKTYIIELPAIPIESCSAMKASEGALQHALKLESQGFYDQAVAECRKALEPFLGPKEKEIEGEIRTVPQLKSSWETRLGKATYEWLNASLAAVKQGTNPTHHLSSKHFEQLEAQMILAVTTSLVAYAVKTMPDDST